MIRYRDGKCIVSTSAGKRISSAVVALLIFRTWLKSCFSRFLASVDAFDIGLTKDIKIESGALLSSSLNSHLKVLVVHMCLSRHMQLCTFLNYRLCT